ncbi:hypothetical protein IID26_00095 [Patescibacteria group bacterium]|nr:hypothetical protein [Patescibacteria group bacterium]
MIIEKIKKEKVEELKAWGKRLMGDLHEEAIASMREENITHEYMGIFEIDGEWYGVGFMQGENIQPATDKEINNAHKKIMKEACGKRISIETIYRLKDKDDS